jgi:hypothetical protein
LGGLSPPSDFKRKFELKSLSNRLI